MNYGPVRIDHFDERSKTGRFGPLGKKDWSVVQKYLDHLMESVGLRGSERSIFGIITHYSGWTTG